MGMGMRWRKEGLMAGSSGGPQPPVPERRAVIEVEDESHI